MKTIKTSDGKKGGSLIGKSHANGGIKAVVVDTQRPIEVESGEVIINKHAAKKHWRKLSEINQSAGNGVPIEEPIFEGGGNFDSIDKKEIYKKWKELVNMSYSELKDFYESKEGKEAGLTKNEAREQGIHSGRESAEWIMKMKKTPMSGWTLPMWRWAKRQISFISRMSGNKGSLYDDKGNKTRKYTSLLIWGNNPEKYAKGGLITCSKCNWSWDKKDTQPHDAYVCHKCGYDNELKKGIKAESEHIKTAKDLYEHNITPKQAAKSIAKEHLKEDPQYYTKLLEKFKNGGGIDETFSFKTPTGEPSRLTYLQQVLVRTKAFKTWFGDWETAAKNFLKDNKENYDVHYKGISKVIDGITREPKVVYHGTRTADEFFMFDVSKEKGVGRPYAYFAHNEEYSENFTTISQRGHNNSKPFMYNCFLCIKNPFMAKGHEYSDKKKDAKSWIRTIVGTMVLDKYETIERNEKTKKFEVVVKEQIEKYLNEAIGNDKRPFWAFMARDKNSEFKMFLVSHGYDGIFYTEEYSSLYDIENPKEFTEAVTVFNPNDIKLADGRNLNFNPMQSDIRYETGGNLEEPIKEDPILSKKDRLGKLLFGEKYAVGGGINKENSIMPKTNETSENRKFVDNLIKKIHE